MTAEYIFVNGRRLARKDVASGAVHFYLDDHLGSSSVVVSSAGVIENESDFYPFGGERVVSQSLGDQHFKFTGKERDAESGLDYFGARYYSGAMGRFMSPDWAAKAEPVPFAKLTNPQSLNLYAYVQGNPEIAIDPDGHHLMTFQEFLHPRAGGSSGAQTLLANFLAISRNEMEIDFANYAASERKKLFDKIWSAYPSHETHSSNPNDPNSIQALTGINVVNTCALRLSYAMVMAGIKIKKSDAGAVEGSNGHYYMQSQIALGAFITKNFGSPETYTGNRMQNFRFNAEGEGFVSFSTHFVGGTASGHIALYRDHDFHEAEDDYSMSRPGVYTTTSVKYWEMR